MKTTIALFIFILCGAVTLSACTFGGGQETQIPTTPPIPTAPTNDTPTTSVTSSPNPTSTPDRSLALKECASKFLADTYETDFVERRFTITTKAEEMHIVEAETLESFCERFLKDCDQFPSLCEKVLTVDLLIRWEGNECEVDDHSYYSNLFTDCPAPTWAPDEPRKIELSELLTTSAVTIMDDWTGLSLYAPEKKHYSLKKEGNQFQGNASISIGEYLGKPRTASTDIQIPAEVMAKFFEKLTETVFDKGYYLPTYEHTDDYPTISIDLSTGNGPIQFMTTSQGDYHTPWKVIFQRNGHSIEYRTDSTAPFEALTLLEPYLGNDVIEQLIQQFEKDNKP